ncbi:aldo/keto reductase [Streptomyces sp. NBC_01619]|uniref:aldo/keto reductase n=1 Tax=Streptomyces sp. NBC_01619 TaxID=2975901 RepID=UPI002250AEF0|nr:aldo/keto reductase [Streptomyces sp. NBC_01619]MCX4515916.1 aldo/keto reductase [Streptomyces sp. NBC_01619]
MSITPPAGSITIAGKTVSRLGFGTMRLTGPGTWDYPAERELAIAVLRRAVYTHGITHIDTADAYGPHTVEELIHEALHPYPDNVLIATKVGMVRPGPNIWAPLGRPEYLRACVEGSLRRLRVERLELCYLHRIDPEVPLADQVGTLQALQDEGKIGHIGLSKATSENIREAGKQSRVAAVQNVLNMSDRDDPAVELCRDLGIPYVPYRPLNAGRLAQELSLSAALDWLFRLGNHVAPIPGTSNPRHLDDVVFAAAEVNATV